MDVRFYNFDFELIHIENHIISSNWTLYNNSLGGFELHFALDGDMVSMLKSNFSYAENKMLVAVCGSRQGIVTGVRFGEDCAVFGKTCNWLLSKRACPPFTSSKLNFDGSAYGLAKQCVENCFADVENLRILPCGNFENIFADRIFYRNVYNPVSEVVEDILTLGGGGHYMYFNVQNKTWDLTVTRNKNTGLTVSENNKNTHSMEHIYEIGSCADSAWYEAEVYDSENLLTGFEWKNVSKNEKSGIYRWEVVFSAENSSEALKYLDKKTVTDEISSKIKRLKFEFDYNLGDVVNVVYKCADFNRRTSMVISGIHLGEANNEITEEIILKEATNNGIQL